MCLAVPGKIESIGGDTELNKMARVNFGGIIKEASLAFLPEAEVGNYVLVHAGMAISVVLDDEARQIFYDLKKMTELSESD